MCLFGVNRLFNLFQGPLGSDLTRIVCILIFEAKLHSFSLRISCYCP